MSTQVIRRRTIWAAIILLMIIAAAYWLGRQNSMNLKQAALTSAMAQPVGDLPNMPDKPQPQEIIFDGCPPEGNGGDSQLNLLKNRVDEGGYVPVSFDTLTLLTWPKSVERQAMKDWSPDSRAYIAQYEGIPVVVEGYIVNVRESGPEPANCGRTGMGNIGWRISFTKNPRDDRSTAVIAEVTPRVRLNRKWTLDLVRSVIINDHLPARISGWLFFNPEDTGELGQTRATLWEIHPVMQIEVFQNGRWIPLDKFAN